MEEYIEDIITLTDSGLPDGIEIGMYLFEAEESLGVVGSEERKNNIDEVLGNGEYIAVIQTLEAEWIGVEFIPKA